MSGYLIVVLTRADADHGSERDEFIAEWGCSKDNWHEIFNLPVKNSNLLLLHGCKKYTSSLCEASKWESFYPHNNHQLTKIKKNISSNPENKPEGYLFTHGLPHGEIDNLGEALEIIFQPVKFPSTIRKSYSTKGVNLAVEGLLEEIPDNFFGSKTQELKKEIENLPSGPQMLSGQLRKIQNLLLQVWLDIAILTDESAGADLRNSSANHACEASSQIQSAAKNQAVRKYLANYDIKKEAKDMLAVLRLESVEKIDRSILGPYDFWSKYTEFDTYNMLLADNVETLKQGFLNLTSTIDTILSNIWHRNSD